jgi:hypothetical protein
MEDEKVVYNDFPFDKMCEQGEKLIGEGYQLFQKFTCAGCGNRLTMDVPNTFFEQGTCDNCDTITDIKKQGCNYLMHITLNAGAQ